MAAVSARSSLLARAEKIIANVEGRPPRPMPGSVVSPRLGSHHDRVYRMDLRRAAKLGTHVVPIVGRPLPSVMRPIPLRESHIMSAAKLMWAREAIEDRSFWRPRTPSTSHRASMPSQDLNSSSMRPSTAVSTQSIPQSLVDEYGECAALQAETNYRAQRLHYATEKAQLEGRLNAVRRRRLAAPGREPQNGRLDSSSPAVHNISPAPFSPRRPEQTLGASCTSSSVFWESGSLAAGASASLGLGASCTSSFWDSAPPGPFNFSEFAACFPDHALPPLPAAEAKSSVVTLMHRADELQGDAAVATTKVETAVEQLEYSLTRSLARSRTHSLTHSLTRSLTCSLNYLLAHSLTRSLLPSLPHSLTPSLTCPLTHLLTRSLASLARLLHSLACLTRSPRWRPWPRSSISSMRR